MYEHGFDEQHDAGINFGKIIFSKFVPIVLPTVSLTAERNVHDYVVTHGDIS